MLAVRQLKDAADSAGVAELLQDVVVSDPFVEVRREAAEALGRVHRLDVAPSLIAAYGDRAASVRSAALLALRSYSTPDVLNTLRYAFDNDSSYNAVNAALAALRKADSSHAQEYFVKALGRDSHRETFRIAALRGLGDIGGDTAYALVRRYTAYGYDRGLRSEAARILARVWKSKPDVAPLFITFLSDPSRPFRRVAAEQLGVIGDTAAIDPLRRAAVQGSGDRRLVTAVEAAVKRIQDLQQKNQKSE
jgi:HEAT repeat protein